MSGFAAEDGLRMTDGDKNKSIIRTWGLTDGSAGMVAQVQALAGALGISVEMKTIALRKPWSYLPARSYASPLRARIIPHFLSSDSLAPPWPDMVISCGRKAAIVAMGLRHLLRKNMNAAPCFICLQDPRVNASHFDLVIALAHDRITGPNVIKTRYALHNITPQTLESARQRFAAQFSAFPAPYVSVLLGGSTHKYTLTPARMTGVIGSLEKLLLQMEGSLLITASRRTGEANIARLREAFSGHPRVFIYDGNGENPYAGLLALADYLVVTNDSVNMMSEARATGKSLYILPLPGHLHSKPARFAQMLIAEGIARPLGERMEHWQYPQDDEMARLREEVRKRLKIP